MMPKTTAQALAEQLQAQVFLAETVLELAGMGTENDRTDTVVGPAEHVLSVRGHVADVALTSQVWYSCMLESGALRRPASPEFQVPAPASLAELRERLSARETQTGESALHLLRSINEEVSGQVKGLSDEDLDAMVKLPFPSDFSLRDLLFRMLTHGSLHLGQAWGLLKIAGITDHGFEYLRARRARLMPDLKL